MKNITTGDIIKTLASLPKDTPVLFWDEGGDFGTEGKEFYSYSSILQATDMSTGKESILLGCHSYVVDNPFIAGEDRNGQPSFTFKKLLD